MQQPAPPSTGDHRDGGFAAATPRRGPALPYYARPAIGALKELVDRGALALDIAAGTGILAGQLQRAGLRLVALEASADPLRQLARALPGAAVLAGASAALPLREGSVDLVVCTRVDLLSAPDAVHEAGRVLRPGGYFALLVTVPEVDASDDGQHEPLAGTLLRSVAAALGGSDPTLRRFPHVRSGVDGDAGVAHMSELWLWERG